MLTRRKAIVGGIAASLTAASARAQGAKPELVELLPPAFQELEQGRPNLLGDAADSFSVESQGYGSFTGLAYTIPAHTRGRITAQIQTLAITSTDVQNLNNLIRGMLNASQYERVRDYERTHASANISYWGFWSGGGGASYEKIHESIRGFGLSEENIRTIVSAMSEIAKKMSRVQLDFDVDNTRNPYSVSGSLLLYTIAGSVKTQNSQDQYRLLADVGTAGSGNRTAPARGKIIPLN
jgi:hypothetical protein